MTFERHQTMHARARDPQRLAARDEEVGFQGFPKDAVGPSRDGLDYLLVVVEVDQEPLIAQKSDDGRDRLVRSQGKRQTMHPTFGS
jgi:hypothetical protein